MLGLKVKIGLRSPEKHTRHPQALLTYAPDYLSVGQYQKWATFFSYRRTVLKSFFALFLYDFIPTPNKYATDLYLVYILKKEYVPKTDTYGLKMMVKSGLEKIFLTSLNAQSLFRKIFFIP